MSTVDAALLKRARALRSILRPTPVVRRELESAHLSAKLEYLNGIGSIKDRPAYWILHQGIARGEITRETTVIESSSGNFANALATFCRLLELPFIAVIDPNITTRNEAILRASCRAVVRVDTRDDTGGFLKTRLRKVRELCAEIPTSYWPNQYANPDGPAAHYRMTGDEICDEMQSLDYAFIGVSSAGTIAGLSRRLKEKFPNVKVIAVDAEGSVIFGGKPRKRFIPGIGASIVPEILADAIVDDVVHVSEIETVDACHELLAQHQLFVGGSSGAAYAAIKRTMPRLRGGTKPNILFLCCDRGTAYVDTVFNPTWREWLGHQSGPPSHRIAGEAGQ